MNKYSDLQDTKLRLLVELETVGQPDFTLTVQSGYKQTQRFGPGEVVEVYQTYALEPMENFNIVIELQNKVYTTEYETAVVIRKISVDHVNLVPNFNHLAKYNNDHNNTDPTNYLGFNGKWTLTIDRPFYQWLHQATGQGWLLS